MVVRLKAEAYRVFHVQEGYPLPTWKLVVDGYMPGVR
jgi:hypothetical protein